MVNDLAPPPTPSPLPTADTEADWDRETALSREMGGGGGRGAKSYDSKKAWSSIYHSKLSEQILYVPL